MEVDTSRSHHRIVPFPTFMVRCVCGYAHDSAQETPAKAIEEISTLHPTPHASDFIPREWFTVTAYPTEGPHA